MSELFDGDFYAGPPLTPEMVARAEQALGVKLPASYLEVLERQNGGDFKHQCLATDFANTWADDHIESRRCAGSAANGASTSSSAVAT